MYFSANNSNNSYTLNDHGVVIAPRALDPDEVKYISTVDEIE